MSRTNNLLLAFGLMILTISCEDESILADDHVSISIKDTSLKIENSSGKDLYLFIADRDDVAAINWTPSVAGEPILESLGEISYDVNDAYGFDESTNDLIVYSWYAIMKNGQKTNSTVNTLIFTID